MGLFGKKNGISNNAEEMQNWYSERYSSVAIQRNFLLIFSVFISLALLICLIIVKNLQEGKATAPYLIEYDKKTGYMTIVEEKSKKEYTAQQAVKESMVMQYLYHREGIKLTTIEEDMNYVRVNTLSQLYNAYSTNISKDISKLRSAGQVAKYDIKVNSISYLAANRVKVGITKTLVADDVNISSMDYNIVIGFNFAELELPIEDMRINPLGFQVTFYNATEIKTFKSSLLQDKENDTNVSNNNVKNIEQNENIDNDEDDNDDNDKKENDKKNNKKDKKKKKGKNKD